MSSNPKEKDAPEFQVLPLEELRESESNPRRHFGEEALRDLTASIGQHGILTPLLVRPVKKGYEIAAGARRSRAAKLAGLTEVPAIVRPMNELEFLEVIVLENDQREDVHPIEEGEGYRALVKAGYTIDRIAERVGRSRFYVYDRIKLGELTPAVQKLFFDGEISFGHAQLLSRLKVADQARAAEVDALFELEVGLRFENEEDRRKAVSVRELRQWIDEHVRFDPAKSDTAEIFPETADAVSRAQESAEKVYAITRDYSIAPDARTDQRVLTARTWKRADGEKDYDLTAGKVLKSKTCDTSSLGVVAIGPGRGENFRVCIDKECDVHWGKEQREAAKRSQTSGAAKRRQQAQDSRYKSEEAARTRVAEAWKKAGPQMLEALAEKVAAAKGIGAVGQLVIDSFKAGSNLTPAERGAIQDSAPKGKTAEAFLKHAAILVLGELVFDDWDGPRRLPKMAKGLGVDLAKILKAHEPATTEARP